MVDDRRVGVSRVKDPRALAGVYASQDQLSSLIQEAAAAAGLGETNPAAPFSDIVKPGATVLLKPNWVLHVNRSGAGMDCMVTHPAFILAALKEVIAAGAGRVLIADAPIQVADFDRIATPQWRKEIRGVAGDIQVDVIDFRNTISTIIDGVLTRHPTDRHATREVLFDLGPDSLLEAVSLPPGRFRNTCYDPDEMAKIQGPGVHKFLLCAEAFEADVILNLPKLKAHAKAGVTAALKNVVGLNADKNFLPHHRLGGSALGGDCYEGLKPFKRLAELFLDHANRHIGDRSYRRFVTAARISNAIHGGDLDGKWAGNDTSWRMVLDLNRILLYGDAKGVMHDEAQRRVFSLTDAIIAGDRNGPLAPESVPLGAVTFAANSAHADAVHLALMGFDQGCVPLVREAFRKMRWRLADERSTTEVRLAGHTMNLGELAATASVAFRPPDGWVGRVHGL